MFFLISSLFPLVFGHFHALDDDNPAETCGGVPARKSFRATSFFWRATSFLERSRPKREGFVDPQFRLLSVGSIWLDPNIVIYANEGRERAVLSNVRATLAPN